MTLRLLLIRHGLSSFNLQNRIQGRNDLSTLTDEGLVQAKKAAKQLAQIPIDSIYSSPLQRAADTAKELVRSRDPKLKINFDKNLLEVDLAPWSGLTIEQVQSNFPDEYKTWKKDPKKLVLQNSHGKSYSPIKELIAQSEKFLQDLLEHHKPTDHKNILIVGHNAILRCLILNLLGQPENGFRRLRLDNASISLIKINADINQKNSIQIETLNNTAHLDSPIPKKNKKARILLIRHGETNWNKEGRFQGQIDIPLNENGKAQAKSAQRFLQNVQIDKAYSSSMSRPMETAEIILGNRHGINVKPLPKLVEIGHGLWEGKLESEIKKDWGVLLKEWQASPEKVQMPEGETINEVSNRAISCWDNICESLSLEETALVVAHDAVNKTILCNLLGLSPAEIWLIKQGNGGITAIDLSNNPEEPSIIACLNITSHLGGVLDNTAQGAL